MQRIINTQHIIKLHHHNLIERKKSISTHKFLLKSDMIRQSYGYFNKTVNRNTNCINWQRPVMVRRESTRNLQEWQIVPPQAKVRDNYWLKPDLYKEYKITSKIIKENMKYINLIFTDRLFAN
jgi:hypothetical protein